LSRPDQGEADLRGWEWRYWNRLSHAAIGSFIRTSDDPVRLTGPIESFAVSPDGRLLAIFDKEGLAIFDSPQRLRRFRLNGPVPSLASTGANSLGSGTFEGLSFRRDGRHIAVAGLVLRDGRPQRVLQTRDLSDGRLVWSTDLPIGHVLTL